MCKLLLGLSLPLCNGFHWRSCFQSRQLLLKQPRSCRQVVDSDAPSIDHKVDVDLHLHLFAELFWSDSGRAEFIHCLH